MCGEHCGEKFDAHDLCVLWDRPYKAFGRCPKIEVPGNKTRGRSDFDTDHADFVTAVYKMYGA